MVPIERPARSAIGCCEAKPRSASRARTDTSNAVAAGSRGSFAAVQGEYTRSRKLPLAVRTT